MIKRQSGVFFSRLRGKPLSQIASEYEVTEKKTRGIFYWARKKLRGALRVRGITDEDVP